MGKCSIDKNLIRRGIEIADAKMYQEDKIWSRYSNDKVDIGEELAGVIRVLSKTFPLTTPLRALSIGSSAEPQFRILETAFTGGLYLFDLEREAHDVVRERIERQHTRHVKTIHDDYNKIFPDRRKTEDFLKRRLDNRRVHLVTLHHSLYYCKETMWKAIFSNLYRCVLAPKGVIHAVLMASGSGKRTTTTWLYEHFVGKFFGCLNTQNLRVFRRELLRSPLFKDTKIVLRTNNIRFFVNDFEKFMAVVWMILLYPEVHQYSFRQREQITEYMYKNFWIKKQPLMQAQDHMILYRNIDEIGR